MEKVEVENCMVIFLFVLSKGWELVHEKIESGNRGGE